MNFILNREKGQEDSSTSDTSRLRGFSLPHDLAPVVAVCTDNSRAKTFTLFHELAHLGIQDGATGACHVPIVSSDATEKWCDRVAGVSLVPTGELRRYVDSHRLLEGKEDQMVNLVAGKFKVSKRAAAVALEHRLGIEGLYRRTDGRLAYRDRNPRIHGGGGTGFDRVERRIDKFGLKLIKTVLEHFAQGVVTEAQVRRFLQLGVDEIFYATHRLGVDVLE